MILILMIFAHIVDDYYLQGWLASGKQRNWWVKNAPDEKYKNDYIMALLMHAFSWSFMITLPLLCSVNFKADFIYIACLILNFIIHAFVDNLKANKGKINLIQDQSIHLLQIVVSFIIFQIMV